LKSRFNTEFCWFSQWRENRSDR